MNRSEVIESLHIIEQRAARAEAELISLRELAGRVRKSLEKTPSQPLPPSPPERDPEGFYAEPKETFREPPPQTTNGNMVEFQAEVLDVGVDNGVKTFKAKGGQWKKWGVRVWPEVLLSDFGIDPDALTPVSTSSSAGAGSSCWKAGSRGR